MSTTWVIGDLLTGRRIQTLSVLSGSWSDVLNEAGTISCTVSLKDPAMKRLGLRESAAVGKSFLAAVDGDTVLQHGPIWVHEWDDQDSTLTLSGAGMWSYFDHRMVLPVLAGRLPTDPTTDTVYAADSLHDIVRGLVAQAQSWTNGNVPVNLPATIAGTATRTLRGADLAPVGQRLRELTDVEGGPDISFAPRWTTDRLGVECDLRIGTPTEPLLFSAQDQVFYVGVPDSSVTNLKVNKSGKGLASQVFATGGRSSDQSLVAVATDATLTNAGYPLLENVDSSHSTVVELPTLQGYVNESVLRSRTPMQVWTFTHSLSSAPFLSSFNVGDFASIRVTANRYLADGEYRMRILSRSGDAEGRTVDLTFAPEVV